MAFNLTYGDRPYWLQYVFDGKAYQCSKYFDTITKNEGTVNMLFRVGKYIDDTTTTPRLIHILDRTTSFESGGGYTIDVIEGPTITDLGTSIPYETTNPSSSFSNLNRQSEIKQDSVVELYYGTTFTGGLEYSYEFVPVGGQKGDIAAFSSGQTERILQPNTDYIVRITNNSITTNGTAIMSLVWYESGE